MLTSAVISKGGVVKNKLNESEILRGDIQYSLAKHNLKFTKVKELFMDCAELSAEIRAVSYEKIRRAGGGKDKSVSVKVMKLICAGLKELELFHPHPRNSPSLLRSIYELSIPDVSRPNEGSISKLPAAMLVFRRSYLDSEMVNVGFAEIYQEEGSIRYREWRTASTSEYGTQKSRINGTIVCHRSKPDAQKDRDIFYFLGLNEFSTVPPDAEESMAHLDIKQVNLLVISSVLPIETGRGLSFAGIYTGAIPSNHHVHPTVPFSSRVLMIATERNYKDAHASSLIGNHLVEDLKEIQWTPDEKTQLSYLDWFASIKNNVDGTFGILVGFEKAGTDESQSK
jgi:hypothetical protein